MVDGVGCLIGLIEGLLITRQLCFDGLCFHAQSVIIFHALIIREQKSLTHSHDSLQGAIHDLQQVGTGSCR